MHLQRGRSSPTAAASLVEAGAVVQRAAVAGGQAVHGRVQDAQLLQVFRPLRPLDHLRDKKKDKEKRRKRLGQRRELTVPKDMQICPHLGPVKVAEVDDCRGGSLQRSGGGRCLFLLRKVAFKK